MRSRRGFGERQIGNPHGLRCQPCWFTLSLQERANKANEKVEQLQHQLEQMQMHKVRRPA